MRPLSGWGNYPVTACRTLTARGTAEIMDRLNAAPSLIARGNGRSYGDAAINPDATLLTARHNRILDFDPVNGLLTCESGVLLSDLIELFLPTGWFPPVTPGTRHITLGGMVAADVHGKNHHGAGCLSAFLEGLEVTLANGQTLTCSPRMNRDLFFATCGGMGLTGVINKIQLRLMPVETGWIVQDTVRCRDLAAVMDAFDRCATATYSVAWIDCIATGMKLGRSLLFCGEHLTRAELPSDLPAFPTARRTIPLPWAPSGGALRPSTIRAFNHLYYGLGRTGRSLVDWESYFYPLDRIAGWNRLYGRRGFFQHQSVLPRATAAVGLRLLLDAVARAGTGSFLAVLKKFGPAGGGLLSFPMDGYTLALDFPVSPANLALADRLDAITIDHGGRLYLAKDARMSADTLRQSYPSLAQFQDVRRNYGAGLFQSNLSRRLEL